MIQADLIITNGSVRTMDASVPRCEAVAMENGLIRATGSNAEILKWAGPRTRVVDAAQRLVLPGFNDAHVHFLAGGFSLTNVNLRSSKSPEEMARRLADHARTVPKGTWILGGEWDHENWPGTPEPTRQMIDAATPDHPVFVNRLDGHMVLANSVALRLAGITRSTREVPGGLIVRDAAGEPTGLLKDAAENLVTRVIPERSAEEKAKAAKAASAYALTLGVTSVTDVSADRDIGLYHELAERGELKTRIYGARPIPTWEVAAEAGLRSGFGNRMIRTGLLKGFSDGSLGSTTALFFEPYADSPHTSGLLFDQMLPEGIMLDRALKADAAGLQVAIHAIGDKANVLILDLFDAVAGQNPARDRRFRIEHAQHLRKEDIARFGRQRVIASMQPYHAADDGRWCEKRIGPARSRSTYAFRSLLDSGAVLAFGSDWTVAPLDPLTGIKAAVTRQTLDGKHPAGWVPEEKITVEEAVRAYTIGAAYAEFAEAYKGSITPGKVADLVILNEDLFMMDPSRMDQARVVLTVFNGRVEYERR